MPEVHRDTGAVESRARGIRRLAEHLRRTGSPRARMAALVAATGAAGFLSSAALLRLGLVRMWVRYPVSVVLAYLSFLLLLRMWMGLERDRIAELGTLPRSDDEAAGEAPVEVRRPLLDGTGVGASDLLWGLLAIPSEGGCMVAVALALLAVFISAAGVVLVIADAPVLLAEVLLDGLLSAGLYRRMSRTGGGGSWLDSAVSRTGSRSWRSSSS